MKRNTIECAEALTYLKTLPDCAVHSVICSPPYFGLRNYGTASWEGGDPACDHVIPTKATKIKNSPKQTTPVDANQSQFRETCGKCGATRVDQQLGLESTPEAYIARLVDVFREARRVLRDDGTLWIVIGDSYAGSWGNYMPTGKGGQRPKTKERWERPAYKESENWRPPTSYKLPGLKEKDLMMIPARLAIALCDDGWYLRQEIIWSKPNGMPASMKDRCTRSHETIYMLAKKPRYWYDAHAIKRPAQSDSNARLLRGNSDHHKNVNGAPGQPSHSIHQPRPNRHKQDGVGKRQYEGFNERYYDNPVPMANARSVWTIATTSGMAGHYATFPPKLVERMILAGCPHKTCGKCGAPWVREYKKTGHVNGREPAHAANNTPTKVDSTGWKPTWRLTGNWIPTCKCETTETVPGIVLDPFMGSGTTARVAVGLGRDYLGCDLNADYVTKALKSLERGIQMPLLEVLQA